VARADPAADAKDLFAHGRELRVHGDCASAVSLFRKAFEVYPAGLGSLRNLAECEESIGQFASARRTWLDLKRALLNNQDHKYNGWAQDADEGAARVAPKVPTLTIDVNAVGVGGETASNDGVEVTVNGERLQPSLLGTPLERDPGHYTVHIAGSRVSTIQDRVFELAPGEAKRLSLRVTLATDQTPPPPQAEPGPTAASPPEQSHESAPVDTRRRTAGWVAIGVGAAGWVGAGISFAFRQGAILDLQHDCGSTSTCPASQDQQAGRQDESRGHTASTLVNVFGLVGIAGLAGGVALLATSQRRTDHTSLVLSPTGLSLAGRF
jgi:hypothetical protein